MGNESANDPVGAVKELLKGARSCAEARRRISEHFPNLGEFTVRYSLGWFAVSFTHQLNGNKWINAYSHIN